MSNTGEILTKFYDAVIKRDLANRDECRLKTESL